MEGLLVVELRASIQCDRQDQGRIWNKQGLTLTLAGQARERITSGMQSRRAEAGRRVYRVESQKRQLPGRQPKVPSHVDPSRARILLTFGPGERRVAPMLLRVAALHEEERLDGVRQVAHKGLRVEDELGIELVVVEALVHGLALGRADALARVKHLGRVGRPPRAWELLVSRVDMPAPRPGLCGGHVGGAPGYAAVGHAARLADP